MFKYSKTFSTSLLFNDSATVHGSRQTHTHIGRGVHHNCTPVHSLLGAGSHRLRPAVVELACHCCLITTSWPESGKKRHQGDSLLSFQTSLLHGHIGESILLVQSVESQLHG